MLTGSQLKDLLERAISTYVQVFLGLLGAANFGFEQLADLSVVKTCAVAALPAGLSVLKGLAAAKLPFGDKSASLLRVGYETVKTEVIEIPVERVVVKKPATKSATKASPKKAAPKKA